MIYTHEIYICITYIYIYIYCLTPINHSHPPTHPPTHAYTQRAGAPAAPGLRGGHEAEQAQPQGQRRGEADGPFFFFDLFICLLVRVLFYSFIYLIETDGRQTARPLLTH